MYIVHDTLTDTMIGPYQTEEDALRFLQEAADLLNDGDQFLAIYETVEAQEWALDNLATAVVG